MPPTYLDEIIATHRRRAAADDRPWRERVGSVHSAGASFVEALGAGDTVAVIAEIKRRSPSKGDLNAALDPAEWAERYRAGGAAAVSVLTDERYFGGSPADLAAVRGAVSLPVLRKDFTVCENDVLDAVEWGASALLLIVAALSDDELRRFGELATSVGLTPLFEVHDEAEVDRALAAGARVVGVNQRDLHSFDVDPERAARLVERLPIDVVRVCESGLRTAADVRAAATAGFDAVLVGEALVTADDPEGTLEEFASVARER